MPNATGWLLLACMLFSLHPVEAQEVDLVVGPYLQNPQRNSVTIAWETQSPVVGKVVYGENMLLDSAAEEQAAKIHQITLKGLKPGTTYQYRCAWGSQLSKPAQFTTAPSEDVRQCRIAVYGESLGNVDTHSKIAGLIAEEQPDLVLHTGDLVSEGNLYDTWKIEWFEPIQAYAPSIPWLSVPGEHDEESRHYYNYVSLPGKETWWSTDYANVHIVGLNTCLPCDRTSEQYAWLQQDLRRNRKEWTLILLNRTLFPVHPLESTPQYRWALQEAFQEAKVDLVLAGHDRYYLRTYPIGPVEETPRRGVVHLTAGGGGAELDPLAERPYSAYRAALHHFIVLDVGGDRIVGRTIDVDGQGFDAFILDKQALPSPEEYVSVGSLFFDETFEQNLSMVRPVEADGRSCEVEMRLENVTDFKSPVRLRGEWYSGRAWEIKPRRFHVDMRPGHRLSIPVQAEARVKDLYPLPTLRLQLSPTLNQQDIGSPPIGFRNSAIELRPFRVFTKEEADPRDIKQPPLIDGQLTERDWERAFVIERFVADAGTNVPTNRTEFLLMKTEETLFVGARVEQDPLKLRSSAQAGRDNRNLVLHENIGVHIWNGEAVHHFYIGSKGDVLDMRWGDTGWDCNVAATTNIAGMGWSAEAAIPLVDLSIRSPVGSTWRINVSRQDGVTGEQSEWLPSFSREGTEPIEYAELEL